MEAGERSYGVSNLEYDIVTTLSNLLEGAEALAKYEQDAQQAGDQDCARIFREIRERNRQSAIQLREALANTLSKK